MSRLTITLKATVGILQMPVHLYNVMKAVKKRERIQKELEREQEELMHGYDSPLLFAR